MSNSSIPITIDLVFNLISAVLDILALLVCLAFIYAILYRLIRMKHNRRVIIIDVPLILSINIICVIFIKSTLQIVHVTIPTLMEDFQIMIDFKETSFYRFRAYMFFSMIGVLFWSYCLLAFFSFVQVIYPTKLWLHRSSLYLHVLIPGQLTCVFISFLPLLFIFDSLHQIPDEAYCGVASTPLYSFIYANTISFILPMNVMCVFYICIARKIRETSLARQNAELHRRDFIVIRRILFNIIILSILSIPCGVLYVISIIENDYGSIIYRVQWISSSTGSCLFSCTLPLVNTRLRDFLKPNRLTPENN